MRSGGVWLPRRAFHEGAEEHGEIPDIVARALARPTLQDLILALLTSSGVTMEELYLGPGPTVLFFLAEALLEYEQQFGQWRFKHVQLVERVIGPQTAAPVARWARAISFAPSTRSSSRSCGRCVASFLAERPTAVPERASGIGLAVHSLVASRPSSRAPPDLLKRGFSVYYLDA